MLDVDVVNSAAYRAAENPRGERTTGRRARSPASTAARRRRSWTASASARAVENAFRPQASGRDELLEDDAVWSLVPRRRRRVVRPRRRSAGSPSTGSAAGRRARFGYVTCLLAGNDRTEACEDALESALARAHDEAL
jgi:hypothetical protein